MDTIERRLTTDVTLAQAVVDLGEIARFAALDDGRPVNLLRIGVAIDALSRYLLDAGAMLYGIAGRDLLSEPGFTSKERMVLGRWLDDGLIEVTADIADRAAEVADLTGLPLVTVRSMEQYAERFAWLRDSPQRVLRLRPRAGSGVLVPADGEDSDPREAPQVAVGKAAVGKAAVATSGEAPPYPEVFATHGAQRISHTRVVRRLVTRAEPSGLGVSLVARQWRCAEPDCPAFGERREIGQPVPRMRGGVPTCPRHGGHLRDVGPRPAACAVSVVVDDLPRQRFAVREGRPVRVGVADGEDAISVAQWAHEAAKAWIGPAHVRLEVHDGRLVVTDVSANGTAVWQRSGPDDPGRTTWLYGSSYTLNDWDSVELYTGLELMLGDRRLATVLGRSEPVSVLIDAPTAALRQLG